MLVINNSRITVRVTVGRVLGNGLSLVRCGHAIRGLLSGISHVYGCWEKEGAAQGCARNASHCLDTDSVDFERVDVVCAMLRRPFQKKT